MWHIAQLHYKVNRHNVMHYSLHVTLILPRVCNKEGGVILHMHVINIDIIHLCRWRYKQCLLMCMSHADVKGIVSLCKSWLLLNELISSKIPLKWVQEERTCLASRYSPRKYTGICGDRMCVQHMTLGSICDCQAMNHPVFSYGQPNSNTDK